MPKVKLIKESQVSESFEYQALIAISEWVLMVAEHTIPQNKKRKKWFLILERVLEHHLVNPNLLFDNIKPIFSF